MKKTTLLLVSLMLIFIPGCSLEPPEGAKPKAGGDVKDIKIGLSISTLNNPFFVSLKDGVVAEATKQGMEVVVVDAQNDSAKQSN
ncbi:D-ribose ABC transporter substrate-binding protein, partial [Clostridium perfringens]